MIISRLLAATMIAGQTTSQEGSKPGSAGVPGAAGAGPATASPKTPLGAPERPRR
jgi:hypothetical protein